MRLTQRRGRRPARIADDTGSEGVQWGRGSLAALDHSYKGLRGCGPSGAAGRPTAEGDYPHFLWITLCATQQPAYDSGLKMA
jgi:hypothetical protein